MRPMSLARSWPDRPATMPRSSGGRSARPPCARPSTATSGCPTRAGSPWAWTGTSERSTAWRPTWGTACGRGSSEDKAAQVAERLLSPEMFTGWGVRTLASSMAAYNPMSYHNGSVWPHDNALLAAGLMRYGFVEHAQRIARGLVDAAAFFGGRLPELFCGFDRDEFPAPVPYPTSCSPQAWAAASPLLLLRSLLRFDPAVPGGRL